MLPRLKSLFAIAAALVGLLGQGAVQAEVAEVAAVAPVGASPVAGLSIRVEGDDWGAVSKQDIEAVLYSVAQVLMPAPAKKAGYSIVVAHDDRFPVVLYDRGAAGEYRVMLHARDANWHLYVYEFAHEFCHVMSNYGAQGDEGKRHNQWFEESLCETASLFALRTLADSWQAAPPAPHLAGGSVQLRWFYDLLAAEEHRHPQGEGMAAWLQDREDELRQNPYQRRKNELVAMGLLPLFSAERGNWQALSYLNLDPADRDCSLDDYLEHWYHNAPAAQKPLVAGVRQLLLATKLANKPAPQQLAANP